MPHKVILVGMKVDLRPLAVDGMSISNAQGMELAREIGADAYVECSSVSQAGVNDVFREAINMAAAQNHAQRHGSAVDPWKQAKKAEKQAKKQAKKDKKQAKKDEKQAKKDKKR